MPGGDGTGPRGMGPMTGRAAGYCAGFGVPGSFNPIGGRGYGIGLGRGFRRGIGVGFGRGTGMWRSGAAPYVGVPYGYAVPYGSYGAPVPPYAPPYGAAPNPQAEMDMLRGQAEYFNGALEEIQKRIEELEKDREKR